MELLQIYFKNLKKLAIFTGTNFLAFFCFYLKKNISRFRTLNADPDLGGKMNAGPDPQPWRPWRPWDNWLKMFQSLLCYLYLYIGAATGQKPDLLLPQDCVQADDPAQDPWAEQEQVGRDTRPHLPRPGERQDSQAEKKHHHHAGAIRFFFLD